MIKRVWQRTYALKTRLLIASCLLLPVFMITSASLLSNAFIKSQNNAEIERLRSMIYSLLSSAVTEGNELSMPKTIDDPRFNDSLSGNFGYLINNKGRILWRSSSAKLLPDSTIAFVTNQWVPGEYFFFQTKAQALDLDLSGLSYDITWRFDERNSAKLRFVVLADRAPLKSELETYQQLLWRWLSIVAVALLALLLLILLWGLRPLKKLAYQLERLQHGEADQLVGSFPHEIQPVVNNFNRVLHYQQQQQQQFRDSLDNLAHSLKTPLAAISAQLQAESMNIQTLIQQTERMNDIISRQLTQAVSYQTALTYQSLKLAPVVKELIDTFEKVYFDRDIELSFNVPQNITLQWHEADLLEVLGNLTDNACKYGKGKVHIEACMKDQSPLVSIHNNGDPISEADAHALLARGARADTHQPGQGIGLSVAHQMITRYGGTLNLRWSNLLKGTCCDIHFTTR